MKDSEAPSPSRETDLAPRVDQPVRDRMRIGSAIAAVTWAGTATAAFLLALAYIYPANLNDAGGFMLLVHCVVFGAQVFALHIALACAVAAVTAAVVRRWRLAATATLLVITGALPTALTWLPQNPPAPTGASFRIHSMNVYHLNHDAEAILSEIRRVDADLLLVQEWQRWHAEHLAPVLLERYPHQIWHIDGPSRGLGIFSRLPFSPEQPIQSEAAVKILRVAIDHAGRQLAIYNLHTSPPSSPRLLRKNRRETAAAIALLEREPLPLLIAGDFNAGSFTPQLAAFRRAGLGEAHTLAGRGPGWTWPLPRGGSLKYAIAGRLPGIRIDHILLSPHLTATHSAVGHPHGSDHRGVHADLAFTAR